MAEFTQAQKDHYTDLGYVLLEIAQEEVKMILTKLEGGKYAYLAEKPSALRLPSQGGPQVQIQGQPAPRRNGNARQVSDTVAAFEKFMGERRTQFGIKQFKLDIPEANWPTRDPFGREFPTMEKLMQMSLPEAKEFVTNSGKPACKVGPYKFYIDDKPGPSHYKGEIKAGDWRAIATGSRKTATYILPEEVVKALVNINDFSEEQVMEVLEKEGLSNLVVNKSKATDAPAAKATKRERASK